MTSLSISGADRFLIEFKAAFLKDLRSYLRYPAWVAGEFISTPLWFFFFVLGVALFTPSTGTILNENLLNFFYFGFVFLVLFSTAVWGIGQTVRNEQLAGTLEQLLLAPVNRVTLIVGRWARVLVTDAIILSYTTLVMYLVAGLRVTIANPTLFAAGLALYEFALLGFGMILAGLTMRLRAYSSISNLIFFLYIILTGALFPIEVIPFPIRYISLCIPFTYFIDLMRHAALSSATIIPQQLELLLAIALSTTLFLAGVGIFRKMEEHARVKGALSQS